MTRKQTHAALPQLTVTQAMERLRAQSLPEQYPSPDFLHGYLCFIILIPSMIHPSEWVEALHDNMEDFPLSMEQSRSLSENLILLYNALNQALSQDDLEIVDTEWNAMISWAQGFELAREQFKHLWEIFLSDVEAFESHDSETLRKQTELSNDLWHKLNISWVGLMSPANPKALEGLRNEESFKNLSEDDLQTALIQDCQATLRFLTHITQGMLRIRESIRASRT